MRLGEEVEEAFSAEEVPEPEEDWDFISCQDQGPGRASCTPEATYLSDLS